MKDDTKQMTAEEFDRLFEEGSDEIDQYLDWSKAELIHPEPKRVNIDFPLWMVRSLDRESDRLGVARQALIKMWLAERLEQLNGNSAPK